MQADLMSHLEENPNLWLTLNLNSAKKLPDWDLLSNGAGASAMLLLRSVKYFLTACSPFSHTLEGGWVRDEHLHRLSVFRFSRFKTFSFTLSNLLLSDKSNTRSSFRLYITAGTSLKSLPPIARCCSPLRSINLKYKKNACLYINTLIHSSKKKNDKPTKFKVIIATVSN